MTGESALEKSFLTGIRVLELANELGEYCGKVLAGLGADVIKVEPLGGEKTRTYGPFYEDRSDPNRSLYFWHYNFGKRGITLDLESEEGRADFGRLAERADVILDARDRTYLRDRGLGYAGLREQNPGLIFVRMSAFGDDGPWADYVGSDLIHLALGGVMMNCGYDPTPDGLYDTPPIAPQMWQSYQIAGEITAIQVVAALCYRLESGEGQLLTTSVHDAVSKATENDIPNWIFRRALHSRLTARHSLPQIPAGKGPIPPSPTGIVMTKDGRWILPYQTYLGGSGSSASACVSFLKDHGFSDELKDYSHDSPEDRDLERDGYLQTLVAAVSSKYKFDRDLWRDAQDAGMPWAPLRRPEENAEDPHWLERGTFLQVEYPEIGKSFTQVGAKWVAPGLTWRTGPRAPLLGEHTREVIDAISEEECLPSCGGPIESRSTSEVVSKLGSPFALGGVRVIDLGWILGSAGGSRFLAAHGAEVIKVEHVSKLDQLRHAGPRTGMVPDGGRQEREKATEPIGASPTKSLNRNGAYMEINSGKLAASLNLKHPKGKELLLALIKKADILVEGYSPGTMERLGLGYETLRETNPRLVYVQQSGMGQIGHYGRMRSFGPSAQAMSGITELSGLPPPYPPAGVGYSYLDWFGAYQIALGMMAGLYLQRTTGKGCWIDSSQVESGIYLTGTAVLDYAANGRSYRRTGNRSPCKPAAPHGVYRVQGEDRWIAIAVFDNEQWIALVRILDHHLANDPRFATMELRLKNLEILDDLIQQRTGQFDGAELMRVLQEAGIPAGICQTAQDRCDWDPQLRHLEWLVELDQTEIGRWPAKNVPVRFSRTPPYVGGILDRHGPNYGEDNNYVFGELLGLSTENINELASEGVI